MGTGEASGDGRALMAAENAIQNPLLDEVTLKGAKAVLVNITGGLDMTLLEVDEAANAISGQVDPEANIIFGAAFDPSLAGVVRVSVVATGMDGASIAAIEHHQVQRRAAAAEPVFAEPEAAAVPAPQPVFASDAKVFEPLRAAGFSMEAEPPAPQQPDLGLGEPTPLRNVQPIARIVDPSVAEDDEPLFASNPYADARRQKSGWMSLFGGRRQEAAPPPPAAAPRIVSAADTGEDVHPDESEDLEIPSFLRRLAN